MARVQTRGLIGETFHIFNRGVDKRTIFEDKQDYVRFYESMYWFNNADPVVNLSFARLQKNSKRTELVEVQSYCLLPNHFHLLLKQKTEDGISEFIKRLSGGYTSYFNEKYDRSGVLFQGPYKRVQIKTSEQNQYVLAYVNENYSVHSLTLPEDIIFSSTWHFRRKHQSKLINESVQYRWETGMKLASDIYTRRSNMKSYLLEN